MAHQVDHKCDRCRRQGEKLFLKGERCYSPKCAMNRRAYAPGQHGPTSRTRTSEYGQQFGQKQKARATYDVLERQFRTYFEHATRSSGVTGEQLLKQLELRLDNAIFRMQLASSRRAARQIVRHGHVLVNGKRVNLPAYALKVGDEIALSERGAKLPQLEERRKGFQAKLVPGWLEVDAAASTAKVTTLPTASDVSSDLDLQQIVEYYSR